MSEIDTLLQQLGGEPVPGALAGMDSAVLAGLGQRREQMLARRALAVAGGVAIFVGLGTSLPGAQASAEPLLGMPQAAPSHLLVD